MKHEVTSKTIKDLRIILGRTQEGMANVVGTTAVTWSRWETGTHAPIPVFRDKLQRLMRFAGMESEG